MCARRPHCKDLCISKSIEERDSIVLAFTPGEAEGSFTRLWFYCKTSLFLPWLCVRQQEKLVWDLLAVVDLQMMDECPSRSMGLVKRQRAEYPVKMVFISFACLEVPHSLSIHIFFFFQFCRGLCALSLFYTSFPSHFWINRSFAGTVGFACDIGYSCMYTFSCNICVLVCEGAVENDRGCLCHRFMLSATTPTNKRKAQILCCSANRHNAQIGDELKEKPTSSSDKTR